jgi:anti-anti-sigma factor
MFKITVQRLGDASVLRCKGQIVVGDACSILRNAILSQRHTRKLVLDLASVDRIDAGGLGVLLDMREWARSGASVFKLMNVTKKVEEILELTHLQNVFEFCSVRDFFCLLHRAASMPSWSSDPSHAADEYDSCDCSVRWQESERNAAQLTHSSSSPLSSSEAMSAVARASSTASAISSSSESAKSTRTSRASA